MPRVTVKMPSGEGVAAGSTATFRLPIGRTYEELLISYSGTTFNLTHMSEIRVMGNGKPLLRYATAGGKTGAEVLDLLNQFDGMAAASGVLVLPFKRMGLRTRQGEELTGIGTGMTPAESRASGSDGNELSTLYVEIDIAAGAVGPVLSMKAIQSAKKPLGLLKKVRHFVYNAGAAGDFEIADLPKGDLINRVVFHNANITNIKLERNNVTDFDRSTAENELVQTNGERTPQTGLAIHDPTEAGFGAESIVTAGVSDLRYTLTLSSGGAVPVTVEYLGPLGA